MVDSKPMVDLLENLLKIVGALATLVGSIQGVRIAIWKRKLTWDDALRVAEKLLTQIRDSQWDPQVILGLGRSGGIWGGWLAGNLGTLPFAVVDDHYAVDGENLNRGSLVVDFPAGSEVLSSLRATYPDKRRMLIVEGASSTGQTLTRFAEKFHQELAGCDVKFAVLYKSPVSVAQIHYVGRVGPDPWPKRFPWHFTDLYRPYLRDILQPVSATHGERR